MRTSIAEERPLAIAGRSAAAWLVEHAASGTTWRRDLPAARAQRRGAG